MGNRGKKRSRLDRGNYGYLFVAPFFLVFLVFGLYPIVYTVYLSFQKWDGLGPISYLGLKNFTRLLGDEVFYLSVWNSFRIWLCNFIPQMAAALLLAFIFTFNRVRGMKFFRAAYYLPNLVTAASVGLLFNLLFNGNKSAVNYILTALNIPGAPFDFFNSESVTSAMVSYIQWWMWFGYTTVIIMAGVHDRGFPGLRRRSGGRRDEVPDLHARHAAAHKAHAHIHDHHLHHRRYAALRCPLHADKYAGRSAQGHTDDLDVSL